MNTIKTPNPPERIAKPCEEATPDEHKKKGPGLMAISGRHALN
jgi:hypothetical protein